MYTYYCLASYSQCGFLAGSTVPQATHWPFHDLSISYSIFYTISSSKHSCLLSTNNITCMSHLRDLQLALLACTATPPKQCCLFMKNPETPKHCYGLWVHKRKYLPPLSTLYSLRSIRQHGHWAKLFEVFPQSSHDL